MIQVAETVGVETHKGVYVLGTWMGRWLSCNVTEYSQLCPGTTTTLSSLSQVIGARVLNVVITTTIVLWTKVSDIFHCRIRVLT